MDLSAEQPLKVPSASVLPGKVTDARRVQPENICLPMAVRSLKITLVRPVQSEKMLFPATRSSVRSISVRLTQPANALSQMEVMRFIFWMVDSERQFLNASGPMVMVPV